MARKVRLDDGPRRPGKDFYKCTGCGRVCEDPVNDLKDLKARGKLSCCPERHIVAYSGRTGEPLPELRLKGVDIDGMTTGELLDQYLRDPTVPVELQGGTQTGRAHSVGDQVYQNSSATTFASMRDSLRNNNMQLPGRTVIRANRSLMQEEPTTYRTAMGELYINDIPVSRFGQADPPLEWHFSHVSGNEYHEVAMRPNGNTARRVFTLILQETERDMQRRLYRARPVYAHPEAGRRYGEWYEMPEEDFFRQGFRT